MGISHEFLESHIREWEERLKEAAYPHRAKWPSRLFHHSPLENAIAILKGGCLRSRSDPQNMRRRDVAAAGVIDNRVDAHHFVRLYFRPRTPTQYHIEGIRKPADCRYDGAHAPVLIMFVLDGRPVLALEDVCFSDRNMQLGDAIPGKTQEYFSSIPFHKVYHEGSTSDHSIFHHRCAEVLAPSPLSLDFTLQWVYCRSEAERDTLLYFLERDASAWAPKIKVSDDLRVFEKTYCYVETVNLSRTGVIFQLNPRRDRGANHIRVCVWNAQGRQVVNFVNHSLPALPPQGKRWRVGAKFGEGVYRIRIDIEGHLAYENVLALDEAPF